MFVIFLLFFTCYIGSATADPSPSTSPKYTLSVAAIFQNESFFLKEWIEYHRMVGVEHFWLYNDNSTDNWQTILAPYLQEGIIEIFDWPSKTSAHTITNQLDAFKDAIKRALNVSEWLALIDLDEFILPLRNTTVTECLRKHFSSASGIYVNWLHFGTNNISLQPGQSILFNLTACAIKNYPSNLIGKSIVRPAHVNITASWNNHHFVLNEPGFYCNGDKQILRFDERKDLVLGSKRHDTFIRINHYRMGDETYFHTVRRERTARFKQSEDLMWQHYQEYNKEKNFTLVDFIRHKHPHIYDALWKDGLFI